MKKAGQILKEEREKKNLSLHEIGMSLKINPKTLQAMEEGDLAKLPSKSFLKGFVKSYAAYLKLDVNEVLNAFQNESDYVGNKSAESVSLEKPKEILANPVELIKRKTPESNDEESLINNKFLLTGIAVFFVFIIVGVAKLVDKYQKERQIDQEQIKTIKSDVDPVEPEKSNEPQDISSNAETLENTNSKNPEINKIIQTEAPVVKAATPIPPVKPLEEKKVEEPKIAVAEVKKIEVPKEQVKDQPKIMRPTEVIIEALNKVTIQYSFSDGKQNTIELNADQYHTFKSQNKIDLEISDGGAINITVNGRDRGVPGSIGKPLKLSYPKQ